MKLHSILVDIWSGYHRRVICSTREWGNFGPGSRNFLVWTPTQMHEKISTSEVWIMKTYNRIVTYLQSLCSRIIACSIGTNSKQLLNASFAGDRINQGRFTIDRLGYKTLCIRWACVFIDQTVKLECIRRNHRRRGWSIKNQNCKYIDVPKAVYASNKCT